MKKKQAKKSWKNVFCSPEINFFFRFFFYLPKLTFFSEIGNNTMCALGRKKHFFSGNALPKYNARAHLR